jgi:chromosome segregation ATPase
MRITVNLDDAAVKLLDASAEAHHESRAEFAGMLLESQLTSQNKIHDQYIQELNQREQMIKRLTSEMQDLRQLLDEARDEARKQNPTTEGEVRAIIDREDMRIEELSAAVARLESAIGQAPAAGDVDRLVGDVADLRARVQARDIQVARLADLERELSRAGERERQLLDLIYQEKGEKKALLERLPPAEVPRKRIWERLLRGGRRE